MVQLTLHRFWQSLLIARSGEESAKSSTATVPGCFLKAGTIVGNGSTSSAGDPWVISWETGRSCHRKGCLIQIGIVGCAFIPGGGEDRDSLLRGSFLVQCIP